MKMDVWNLFIINFLLKNAYLFSYSAFFGLSVSETIALLVNFDEEEEANEFCEKFGEKVFRFNLFIS